MDSIAAELARYGVPFVGLNVFLQQIGLPIPSVPTMMVAGALAAGGRISLPAAFAIAVAASLIADLLWFAAGRRYGYPVLRFLCRISLSPDTCVRQTEGIFERWGFYSVVVSKFVPGFSTVAPPVAGALSMRVGAFVLASAASAALWAGAAMIAGVVFSHEIDAVLTWMSLHLPLAGFAVAILAAAYAAMKAWQRFRIARLLAGSMITVAELRERLADAQPPFVIDIGSSLAQRGRPHIPGAALLDLDALARCDDFPRDRDIVLYCACPNEASARRGAQILLARGYRRVRPLEGGIDAWTSAGHPLAHVTPIKLSPASGARSAKSADVVDGGDASPGSTEKRAATL